MIYSKNNSTISSHEDCFYSSLSHLRIRFVETERVSVEQIGRLFMFLPLSASYSKTKSVRRFSCSHQNLLFFRDFWQIDKELLITTISWNGIIKRISLYSSSIVSYSTVAPNEKVIRLFRIAAYYEMKIQFPIINRPEFCGLDVKFAITIIEDLGQSML